MHEETAVGWPAPPPGSGLASNKATYSSAKMDEEGVPMERQTHGGGGGGSDPREEEEEKREKTPEEDPEKQIKTWKTETED